MKKLYYILAIVLFMICYYCARALYGIVSVPFLGTLYICGVGHKIATHMKTK